jgi:hypothetical protein
MMWGIRIRSRLSMRILAVVVVAACGAPAPPRTRAEPVLPAAKPAPVTCGDAGVILRGSVEDVKKAAPAKEARIASACLHDRWSATVLACIGSEPTPADCLDQLTDVQRASLHTELVAWAELHDE